MGECLVVEGVKYNRFIDSWTGHARQRGKRPIRKVTTEPEIDGGGITMIRNKPAVFDTDMRERVVVCGGLQIR